MAYGIVKVDQITFTNGGVDQTISVSGIVQSISGDITATGTIQGATVIGTSTVSGSTVTGEAGVFTTVTGGSAGFTTVTGTTVTGTTANFNVGTFTSQVSGATVTGNLAQFTSVTGGSAGFTTVTGTTVTGTTANFVTVSGTTVTGNAGQFTAITGVTVDVGGSYVGNVATVSALNIDCTSGNYFIKTITGNSTFTVSNVPASGKSYGMTLEVTHTSGIITWFSGVEWPASTAPTLTTGKTHLFIFVTDDGGARWRGASLVDYVN